MAANGLGGGGFEKLVLERGDLFTIGVNGQRLQVEEEIAVWTMAAAPVDLPEDLQFERVDESPGLLSAKGLDGLFEARRFRVLDDESGRDVAVRLAVGLGISIYLFDTVFKGCISPYTEYCRS